MNIRTSKRINRRPALRTWSEEKEKYMHAFLLSSELSRLENEKLVMEMRMETVNDRIHEIRREIDYLNSLFKHNYTIIEKFEEPRNSEKKSVTIEY